MQEFESNSSVIIHHFDQIVHVYKLFKNENKGIVFKARWFVRPDINTGVTIIFAAWNDLGKLTRAMPASFRL